MGILLAFAPFIVFALVDRIASPSAGLIAGALVSAALLLRDIVTPGRAPKILEVGTFVLFGGLALYAMFGGAALSVIGVRLLVDSGLLLIVLSLDRGSPTLHAAICTRTSRARTMGKSHVHSYELYHLLRLGTRLCRDGDCRTCLALRSRFTAASRRHRHRDRACWGGKVHGLVS
jgi:hypothetical protein